MKMPKNLFPILLSSTLLACSSSNDSKDEVVTPAPSTTTPVTMKSEDKVVPDDKDKKVFVDPSIPVLSLSFSATKVFQFTWIAVPDATLYKLQEAVTNESGYTIVKETTETSFDHVVPLYARLNAKYILQSCNAAGDCTASIEVFTSARVNEMVTSIDYIKASNTGAGDYFGGSVSLSEDGSTLAVGAPYESSSSQAIVATGPIDNGATSAGAVYIFVRSGGAWSPEAYLKADNAEANDNFGISVSLNADGNTLAVGATGEDLSGNDNAGGAYVFFRASAGWSQQGHFRAASTVAGDKFGNSVSLSANGDILAVGASQESSSENGVRTIGEVNGGAGAAGAAGFSGAAYVFTRTGATWTEQAYLKADNTHERDQFGASVSLSADGTTLAVSAVNEDSNATGVSATSSGNANDDALSPATISGAVYVFAYNATEWSQQAYLKASNSGHGDKFGYSVSIDDDGNTLAVGATGESSDATVINGVDDNNKVPISGAVYVFIRDASAEWSQQAFLKASNVDQYDNFGHSVSISDDGNILAVGANLEGSDAIGISGDHTANNETLKSGAVYTFIRSAATWSAQAYIKASNTEADDKFGYSVALSADGGTLAVGAWEEDGPATGVNAENKGNGAAIAGAVYVY